VRGVLALSKNEHDAAEPSLKQALAVARRQGAKFWELRAASSLAWLWKDQGRGDEARGLLAPIYGCFTEGFDMPDLNDPRCPVSVIKRSRTTSSFQIGRIARPSNGIQWDARLGLAIDGTSPPANHGRR
jgi:hypothetical protein